MDSYPQCRYCSEACRQAARRWRRWQAGQRYRGSVQGKERRREQSRRYRERAASRDGGADGGGVGGLVEAVGVAAAAVAWPDTSDEGAAGARTALAVSSPPREGQRPAPDSVDFIERPCVRPGCYELFAVSARSPARRFCSCPCRKALRRVLDREAHWRRRRQGAARRARAACRPAPDSP